MWNRKVFIRIVELLLCISCVVALRVTDDESRRVFHYLRNRSREWSLLNNVTWGTIGAALATATCGGFVIITAGLLVAAATGELRGRITELFFLGLGIILFGIVGALSLASIDSVPEDLVDNAAVLGALCLLTALVFIADLLTKIPGVKKKHDSTQTNGEKDNIVKIPMAILNSEKETKSTATSTTNKTLKDQGTSPYSNGSINTGFDLKSESSTESISRNGKNKYEAEDEPEIGRDNQRISLNGKSQPQDIFEAERNRKFQDVGKQLREYTQSIEIGGPIKYRGGEDRANARKEYFEGGGRLSGLNFDREHGNSYYRNDKGYRRAMDEVDTPLFPTNLDNGSKRDPIFAKIVNPGVKIMRVEREFGNDNTENYRNSDSSQYDNVPARMRRLSPGILKKNRDVSFDVPQPQKKFGNGSSRQKDEIERLEECFNALQTSIGTQTGGSQRDVNSPSSPNDPGYVRHTASNWPYDIKSKTPGSSPEHDK